MEQMLTVDSSEARKTEQTPTVDSNDNEARPNGADTDGG